MAKGKGEGLCNNNIKKSALIIRGMIIMIMIIIIMIIIIVQEGKKVPSYQVISDSLAIIN